MKPFNIENYLCCNDNKTLVEILEFMQKNTFGYLHIKDVIVPQSMTRDELLSAVKKYLTPNKIRKMCDEGEGMFLTYYFTEDLLDSI